MNGSKRGSGVNGKEAAGSGRKRQEAVVVS